jgi:hypothetical protein
MVSNAARQSLSAHLAGELAEDLEAAARHALEVPA